MSKIKNKYSGETFSRKCHDCGKPTNNYRCNECWEKKAGAPPQSKDDDPFDCGGGFFCASRSFTHKGHLTKE